MSMTDSGMAAAIKQAVIDEYGTPDDVSRLDNFANALGKAIVEYIKANAVVTVTGVSSGGSTAPGTIS